MDHEEREKRALPRLIIDNKEMAENMEAEIQDLLHKSKEAWAQFRRARSKKREDELANLAAEYERKAERELSRYVFAQMPEFLVIRAVKMATNLLTS